MTEPCGTRGADDVRHVRRLLGVNRDQIVDRRIRGDDDRIGANVVLADFDVAPVATFDVVGMCCSCRVCRHVLNAPRRARPGI